MPRRTKSKKNPFGKLRLAGKNTTKYKEEIRFSVSVIIMIAFLSISVLILLISLVEWQAKQARAEKISSQPLSKSFAGKVPSSGQNTLDNKDIGFRITVPMSWAGWVYKVGYVKSPVDDSLSDQYVQIFLPDRNKTISKNFDDQMRKMITIIKYTEKEWEKLSSGCSKDNTAYCSAMGEKITDGDGVVYAYLAEKECPKAFEVRCREVDKIISSFQLK